VAWTGARTVPWRDDVWAAEPGGATTVDSEENETVQWLAQATVDWPRRKREAWLMKWASYLARLPVPLKGYAEGGTACRGRSSAAERRQRPEANPAVRPENRHQRPEVARQGAWRCGCSSPRGGARGGASGASGGSAAICLHQQRQERTRVTGAPWKRPSSAMPPDGATAAACLSPAALHIMPAYIRLPLLARDLSSCRSCSVRNFASVEREMKTLYTRHELQSLRVLVWSFVCESLASSACNEPMSQ